MKRFTGKLVQIFPTGCKHAVFIILVLIFGTLSSVSASNVPPRNPFLADSVWPMAHADTAQSDSVDLKTPTGPTRTLTDNEIKYNSLGFFHVGTFISGLYQNGKRVIWTNGTDRIVKMDYDTFDVIDSYMIPGKKVFEKEFGESMIDGFNKKSGFSLVWHTLKTRSYLKDISSLYGMVDKDNDYYLSGRRSLTVYGDAEPGAPESKIVVKRTFEINDDIPGTMVGLNMTHDGYVVLATSMGYVIVLSRDFETRHIVKLKYSEQADPDVRPTRTWVRNSFALDEHGGIYIVSNDHMHRVVWTGKKLSLDETDGAWTAAYRNGIGYGSGATPSLMGFGNEDRFVVITDGDELMNLTLFWRDIIPEDWKQIEGAPSRRIAGYVPVNFGDPENQSVQSEQSVVVAGYGAFVVNNEPSAIPFYLPERFKLLVSGYMSGKPEYQPFGVQKFEWNPVKKSVKPVWVNTRISSPNSVPFVSTATDTVYTVGARSGVWTVEGIDWVTGKSKFHYKVGDERYNSCFAAISTDGTGRFLFGTAWGVVRIQAGNR